MNLRGQISTEYLIVFGFVVFIILGLLGTAFFYTSNTSNQIKIDQVSNFADKIISNSESVFYLGEPSKVTLKVYLPAGVSLINISSSDILFKVSTSSGVNIVSFSSRVPLNGSISFSEGFKRIEILAVEDHVQINEY